MNEPTAIRTLTTTAVDELARLAGLPPLDAATLARIAEGASRAAAAVRASADGSLFDVEPGSFLAELERLAESPQ
jgi:hypothetical protein